MSDDVRDPYKIEAGQRLRRTRRALGYRSARRFSQLTGTSEANLSNWERGVTLVPPSYIGRLKELFGITLDWIYQADPAGLRHELAQKLLEPEEEET